MRSRKCVKLTIFCLKYAYSIVKKFNYHLKTTKHRNPHHFEFERMIVIFISAEQRLSWEILRMTAIVSFLFEVCEGMRLISKKARQMQPDEGLGPGMSSVESFCGWSHVSDGSVAPTSQAGWRLYTLDL